MCKIYLHLQKNAINVVSQEALLNLTDKSYRKNGDRVSLAKAELENTLNILEIKLIKFSICAIFVTPQDCNIY